MSIVLLYVTASDPEEAARIGRALVDERLCACANVIGPVRSIYRWEGAVQDEPEAVLIAKTRTALVEPATARIKALHSYSVPCVVAFEAVGGNAAFLDWVIDTTAAPGNDVG